MTVSKFKRNRNEIEVVMVATESHIDFHIGKVKYKVNSTISNSKQTINSKTTILIFIQVRVYFLSVGFTNRK